MKKSINIVLLFGLPFMVLTILFPKEILKIVSGEQYIISAKALQILGVVPLIIGLCNVFGTQYLLAIGQERKILVATISGFFVNLILNFTLISFWGYLGSAVACVFAEMVVCIFVYLSARKTIKIEVDMTILLLIICSLISTIVFWLFLKNYYDNLYLLFSTCIFYLLAFTVFQLSIFKSKFIKEILAKRL